MENYKVTAVDIEATIGDVYKPTVEVMKPARKRVWMTLGVVVVFLAVCAVAALCFAWYFTNKPQDGVFMGQQGTTSTDTPQHQQMLTQIARSTKAAIHLSVLGEVKEKESPRWLTGVDQSFIKGDLKLEDNTIVIPHDGLYFVYTQASFVIHCTSDDEDDRKNNKQLSYGVVWTSLTTTNKKHYLLNGVKSVCQNQTGEKNGQSDFESVYLGAVFQLYKGDKLSTDTNHLSQIEQQSSKTFFGVFEL